MAAQEIQGESMIRKFLWAAVLNLVGLGTAMASPFALTVEARVGPYIADMEPYTGTNALDVSQGLTAFQCQFGNQIRPIFFVSPQLSVFDAFGTLTLGVEGGFYTARGRKLLSTTDCSQQSDIGFQELNIMPMMVTATYRFDWALDRYRFPLVPYIRAGAGGAGWLLTEDGQLASSKPVAIVDAAGKTTGYTNHDPGGFSFGGKLALGLMVALDFLEPMRALHARAKGIYSHTFMFMEVAAFDAGLNQNLISRLVYQPAKDMGLPAQNFLAPTLIVGAERLPMITGGLAIAF
jgi:hypothetical protein